MCTWFTTRRGINEGCWKWQRHICYYWLAVSHCQTEPLNSSWLLQVSHTSFVWLRNSQELKRLLSYCCPVVDFCLLCYRRLLLTSINYTIIELRGSRCQEMQILIHSDLILNPEQIQVGQIFVHIPNSAQPNSLHKNTTSHNGSHQSVHVSGPNMHLSVDPVWFMWWPWSLESCCHNKIQ